MASAWATTDGLRAILAKTQLQLRRRPRRSSGAGGAARWDESRNPGTIAPFMQGPPTCYGHVRALADECRTRTVIPMATDSIREARAKSDWADFSAHPGWHYFWALTITLLLTDLYLGASVYYCWHTVRGLSSEFCSYERIQNEETAGHHALFVHAALIYYLLLIPILAAVYAPFFWAAIRLSRRWHIQRNVVGIIYWLVAWTLIGLAPLAIVASAILILNIGKSINGLRLVELMPVTVGLGAQGAFSGVVYCLLAFWRG